MTAEEIKAMRQNMGLSMEDFAREVGVSTTTVFRWEKGERAPGRMARKLLGLVQAKAAAKAE